MMNDSILDDTQDLLDDYELRRSVLKKKLYYYVVKGGDIHKLYVENDDEIWRYMVWLADAFVSGEIWDMGVYA